MRTDVRVRASALCVVDDRALLVGLHEPALDATLWFPPGGAVEPGEPPLRTAEREAFEETGYRVRCAPPGRVFRYPFDWSGRRFQCETHFFDAELCEAKPVAVPRDPLVVSVAWVPVEELPRRFTYGEPLRSFLLERYAELARSRKLDR